jgi:hypothetical protein
MGIAYQATILAKNPEDTAKNAPKERKGNWRKLRIQQGGGAGRSGLF